TPLAIEAPPTSRPPVAGAEPPPPGEVRQVLEDSKAPARDAGGERGEAFKDDKDDKDPNRLEYGALPAVNYDSDLGFGFGLVGTLAKFAPGYRPYKWRLELLLYATLKGKPGGGVEVPYHDDYIKMDFPGLLENRLRINAIAGFRRHTTIGYYGLGSDAKAEEPWLQYDPELQADEFKAARRYHQYDRIYPYGNIWGRINVWDRSTPEHKRRLEVFVGLGFVYSVVNLYPGSKLEQDHELAQQDTPDGREMARLLHGDEDHALLTSGAGLLIDTRDHEYTPTRGTFTEISVRGSPGVDKGLTYAGFNLNTSWYQSIYKEWLVFGVRGVADFIVGKAPLWTLTRFGAFNDVTGPGSGWSVRGVPRQRFHGKIKAIGNFELRSMLVKFRIKKQRFHVGTVAFADTGRVWADYQAVTIAGAPLDGGFTDWSLGLGGGLRVKWGETFVVRFDVGHSVTVQNTGFYIDIGHIF
ncbi:MAG: BamA/TamA family outer membrane protein, partial [Myxococcales bacterium]|nr:BamA/TamA family outer membrane protein [Myxococcales bacterium]